MATHETSSRYDDGLTILQRVAGVDRPAVLDSLAEIAPDLARYTVEFAYGDVYARSGLTLRERQLSTVAGLVALGYAAPQLRFHIDGALNVGCSRREIVEVIIHLCVYAGFPATLNAVAVAGEVFSKRPSAPEPDDDPAADVAPSDDRYERGWAALAEIDGEAGEKVIASLQDIAPDLARYIVEFSFGDIYCRPGLDLRTREIVTIAGCTALGTALPQLRVHVHGLLNVGGTESEVVETIIHMAVYAGFPAALNAIAVAREVLQERAREHEAQDQKPPAGNTDDHTRGVTR
jgi:4-carboxymuconolactone decarboxylase